MKMILLASAALALSTAAFAQDSTMQPTQPEATPMSSPDSNAPANPGTPDATPGGAGTMQPGATDSTMTPPATGDSSTMAPSAGGDAAMAPPASGGDQGAAGMASSTDDSNLPTCSKTVTDKCIDKGASHSTHHSSRRHPM